MSRLTLKHVVDIDYITVEYSLSSFLMNYLEESRGSGYVVGVSGGIDSATALALAVRSVGPKKVFALILPDTDTTPRDDVEDAIELVEKFGIEYHIIDISRAVQIFKELIPLYSNDTTDRLPLGNLRARLRMCILYYYANKLNHLVLGTGDRSEYLIGYFTKYGDGAADIAPLTILYKSQVRCFAQHLGIPNKIIRKPSAPRLWPNHLAEEELGIKYEDIDLVLTAYIDLGIPENKIPEITSIDKEKINKILKLYRSSHHKRQGVIMPDTKLLITIQKKIHENFYNQVQE